jgi:hypothetical protein
MRARLAILIATQAGTTIHLATLEGPGIAR